MRSSDLAPCTLDEIKTNLCKQSVTDGQRISIEKNYQTTLTNSYILSFNTLRPPIEIKIGYTIMKIEIYIPNPLRCHNCQNFGRHKEKCTRPLVCKAYREIGIDHLNCKQSLKCVNFKQNHATDSKECETWGGGNIRSKKKIYHTWKQGS